MRIDETSGLGMVVWMNICACPPSLLPSLPPSLPTSQIVLNQSMAPVLRLVRWGVAVDVACPYFGAARNQGLRGGRGGGKEGGREGGKVERTCTTSMSPHRAA